MLSSVVLLSDHLLHFTNSYEGRDPSPVVVYERYRQNHFNRARHLSPNAEFPSPRRRRWARNQKYLPCADSVGLRNALSEDRPHVVYVIYPTFNRKPNNVDVDAVVLATQGLNVVLMFDDVYPSAYVSEIRFRFKARRVYQYYAARLAFLADMNLIPNPGQSLVMDNTIMWKGKLAFSSEDGPFLMAPFQLHALAKIRCSGSKFVPLNATTARILGAADAMPLFGAFFAAHVTCELRISAGADETAGKFVNAWIRSGVSLLIEIGDSKFWCFWAVEKIGGKSCLRCRVCSIPMLESALVNDFVEACDWGGVVRPVPEAVRKLETFSVQELLGEGKQGLGIDALVEGDNFDVGVEEGEDIGDLFNGVAYLNDFKDLFAQPDLETSGADDTHVEVELVENGVMDLERAGRESDEPPAVSSVRPVERDPCLKLCMRRDGMPFRFPRDASSSPVNMDFVGYGDEPPQTLSASNRFKDNLERDLPPSSITLKRPRSPLYSEEIVDQDSLWHVDASTDEVQMRSSSGMDRNQGGHAERARRVDIPSEKVIIILDASGDEQSVSIGPAGKRRRTDSREGSSKQMGEDDGMSVRTNNTDSALTGMTRSQRRRGEVKVDRAFRERFLRNRYERLSSRGREPEVEALRSVRRTYPDRPQRSQKRRREANGHGHHRISPTNLAYYESSTAGLFSLLEASQPFFDHSIEAKRAPSIQCPKKGQWLSIGQEQEEVLQRITEGGYEYPIAATHGMEFAQDEDDRDELLTKYEKLVKRTGWEFAALKNPDARGLTKLSRAVQKLRTLGARQRSRGMAHGHACVTAECQKFSDINETDKVERSVAIEMDLFNQEQLTRDNSTVLRQSSVVTIIESGTSSYEEDRKDPSQGTCVRLENPSCVEEVQDELRHSSIMEPNMHPLGFSSFRLSASEMPPQPECLADVDRISDDVVAGPSGKSGTAEDQKVQSHGLPHDRLSLVQSLIVACKNEIVTDEQKGKLIKGLR